MISVALYAQELCCKIINSTPWAESSRKPFRTKLKNIFSKVTERTRNQRQDTVEKNIEENSLVKSSNSKFSWINLKNLFSEVTFQKLTSTRHQQRIFIPSGSGISETLNAKWAPKAKKLFDSYLLDKDFQCTSTTVLYLSEPSEKDDLVNLNMMYLKVDFVVASVTWNWMNFKVKKWVKYTIRNLKFPSV